MRQRGAEVVRICAKMEEDLNGMDEDERLEFLEEYGVSASGLDQIIQTGYRTLGLISYFTQGRKSRGLGRFVQVIWHRVHGGNPYRF